MGAPKIKPDPEEKIDLSNDREQGLANNFKDPGMDEFLPDLSFDTEEELSLAGETALAVQEMMLDLHPASEGLVGESAENTTVSLSEISAIENPIETDLNMADDVNQIFSLEGDDMQSSLSAARADMAEGLFDLVASERKFNDLVETILATIAGAIGVEAGSILELDIEKDEFFFRASYGGTQPSNLHTFRVPRDKGIVGFVAGHVEGLLIKDMDQDEKQLLAISMTNGLVAKSCIAAPILVGGQLYGVIELFNKIPGTVFTAEDLNILERGVRMAGKALEVRFLMAELARKVG